MLPLKSSSYKLYVLIKYITATARHRGDVLNLLIYRNRSVRGNVNSLHMLLSLDLHIIDVLSSTCSVVQSRRRPFVSALLRSALRFQYRRMTTLDGELRH
jgi:hypothetical protein